MYFELGLLLYRMYVYINIIFELVGLLESLFLEFLIFLLIVIVYIVIFVK